MDDEDLGVDGLDVGGDLGCAGGGVVGDEVDDNAGAVAGKGQGDGGADAILTAGAGHDGGLAREGEGGGCHWMLSSRCWMG